VKVFRPAPGNDSAEALQRFLFEAVSASRINHPNAVSVLDSGISEEGIAYLIMELLTGHTLTTELREKSALSVERCAQILLPICDVLAKAHAAGIVHRDIKPDNIFLHHNENGEIVKVLDFGIAKLLEDHQGLEMKSLTAPGGIIGTPTYMAPERFAGGEYDGRSDVYSLGVVLYEMLSGRLPHHASSPQMVAYGPLCLIKEVQPLKEVMPDLDAKIAAVVMKALAQDPINRPTAKALGQAFLRASGLRNDPLIINNISAPSENYLNGDLTEAPTITRSPIALDAQASAWQKLEKIFHAALAYTGQQQTAFINAVCGNDQQLLRELETLLKAHKQADNDIFLDPANHLNLEQAGSLLGQMIENRYQIEQFLSPSGSRARAIDTATGQEVVIIICQRQILSEEEFLAQFNSAVERSRRLLHANIASIGNCGIDLINGQQIGYLIIDERIDLSLADLIAKVDDLSAAQVINIVDEICAALSYAHQQGVAHGNLRADSIWLQRKHDEFHIKLEGFGFGRLTRADANLLDLFAALDKQPVDNEGAGALAIGVMVETAMAASSSRVMRNFDQPDAYSDIESLGIILFQLLTGNKIEEFDKADKDFTEQLIISINKTRPDLPQSLFSLVAAALSKDDQARPVSIDDFRAALHAHLKNRRQRSEVGDQGRMKSEFF
jgi:serine/threonine protein kinase